MAAKPKDDPLDKFQFVELTPKDKRELHRVFSSLPISLRSAAERAEFPPEAVEAAFRHGVQGFDTLETDRLLERVYGLSYADQQLVAFRVFGALLGLEAEKKS